MDLIDRDEAIDAVERTVRQYHINYFGELSKGVGSYGPTLYKAEDVYEAIKGVPKVDAIPFKWTPCSERLPEEVGTYLVTVNFHGHTYVCMDNFLPSGWEENGWTRLAWAKVPESYKGETK